MIRPRIIRSDVINVLEKTTTLVTYNGSCFDLPVIRRELALDLRQSIKHKDLKNICWRHNLYGGLKKVEIKLGINRGEVSGLDGRDAVILWEKYRRSNQKSYLETLLAYNKADVLNMVILEEKLSQLDTELPK